MKRPVILFAVVLLLLTIVGLFQVKHRVQNLTKDLAEIHHQIATNRQEIHVLKAEWSYLNDPARIKRLADTYLNMEYAKVAQVKDNEDMRIAYNSTGRRYASPKVSPTLRPILSSLRR